MADDIRLDSIKHLRNLRRDLEDTVEALLKRLKDLPDDAGLIAEYQRAFSEKMKIDAELQKLTERLIASRFGK